MVNRGSSGRPQSEPLGRSRSPPAFDAERYKDRNTVERCINKLKAFRAVATRYDKLDTIYRVHSRVRLGWGGVAA